MLKSAFSKVPVETVDPINARILSVSEDLLEGFTRDPIGEISRRSSVEPSLVVQRLRAMLEAGTIRRIRQTLISTKLAPGCLVAWEVPEEKLSGAFDWMFKNDPFSGHVVIRSTDASSPASRYRLWTTLKVPQGFSIEEHCQLLMRKTGATRFVLLPAKMIFTLGVGHVRRRTINPGDKSPEPGEATPVRIVELSDRQWRILSALKREFSADEIRKNLWDARAQEAGVELEEFLAAGEELQKMGVIGRFSTFLEHVKPLSTGERVTRFNALFHWAVPEGREFEAGREIGRFEIMTHAYWRPAGSEFCHVNLMGVAHGVDKNLLLEHKRAIDQHLVDMGIPIGYTNIFWGGRSEIKPSEIDPAVYRKFIEEQTR